MEHWKTGDFNKYEAFIHDTECRFELPRNLLALVLYQASKYDPAIIAGTGMHPMSSIGIAKLTPHDAFALWGEMVPDYSQRHNPKTMRRDPYASIIGAAKLLRSKRWKFGSWKFALLAFHTSDDIAASTTRRGAQMPIDASEYVQQITAQVRV